MDFLVNRAPVDQALFAFTPTALVIHLKDVYDSDPDAPILDQVYAFCHEWVFGRKPAGSLDKHRALLLRRVRESETSIKLFLLANMLGWAHSHPERNFPAKSLTGEFAVNQVKTFAAVCHKQYGVFDVTSLDRLMGTEIAKSDLSALLLSTEMTVGSWIINYKLLHRGTPAEVSRHLYAKQEIALNPYWLATEHTYYLEVVYQHLISPDPSLSEALQRHRSNAIRALSRLKTYSKLAAAVFKMRETVMPEAIRRVLGLRGFQAVDFRVNPALKVTGSIPFWTKLGIAIQHYECLNLVNKYPSALDRR